MPGIRVSDIKTTIQRLRGFNASLTLGVATFALVACGGGSDGSSGGFIDVGTSEETATIDITFAPGLRGPEAEPSVSELSVTDNDAIVINSRVTGTALPGVADTASEFELTYTPLVDREVLIVLSSTEAPNLDLEVSDNSLNSEQSENSNSYEVLLMDVDAGRTYTLTVSTLAEGGQFTLLLTEPNRASLGLTDTEYFVTHERRGSTLCDSSPEGAYVQQTYWIINWAEGYISDPDETLNFTSVDGNAFSSEQTLDLGSVTENFSLTLDTNSTTGVVSGNATQTRTFSSGEFSQCVTEIDFREGQVKL
ncbi:MAG: hypothetical protein C9355_13805 [Thalassolituus maritimus]|nr:MAG: hypothetical protein C9355_13805 [Thalassolituus maritimus]|tara:strand:- start:197 stop:1120 length:924 start_codon:yes stop_codon:yes gene_type:complete